MSEIVRFCPRCRTEYREGYAVCSECDLPLVTRLHTDMGDPLVPLAMETSFDLVAELLDRLEKKAIAYVIQAGTALRCMDDPTAKLTRPDDWEARIYVVSSGQREAAAILDDLKFQRQIENVPGGANRKSREETE